MSEQTSPQPPPRAGATRFFGWLRGLGIVRQDGWISGVSGGIAARIGIDPLIVRGVAIVAALLGAPAFLFYAAAWLLLPDADDRIHLERLIAGVFEPVIIAIGVLAVIDFLPLNHGLWWFGGGFGSSVWQLLVDIFRVLWDVAIVAAIVWFAVWLVHRARQGGLRATSSPTDPRSGGTEPAARTASAPGAAAASSSTPAFFAEPGAGAPEPATAAHAPASAWPPLSTASEPKAPGAPGAGATPDDIAAWRARHTAWRAQHDAWRAQQRADQRLVREQRSAELRARSQEMAAQALASARARQASRPRTSGWYVALALGAALVAGGIAAAVASAKPELLSFVAPIGFAAALGAVGLAMIVAGFMRRRAGFLAFVAIVLAVCTAGGFAWPVSNPSIGYTRVNASDAAHYSQFAGAIRLDASRDELVQGGTAHMDVKQSFGNVSVYLDQGVRAEVDVIGRNSSVRAISSAGGASASERTAGQGAAPNAADERVSYASEPGTTPELVITIEQGAGSVDVYDQNTGGQFR